MKYVEDYNPIIEYNEKIQSGEIIACEKLKKVYQHVVDNIMNSECEFRYDSHKANKALKFFEDYLKHSKGGFAGQLIKLELWQKAFIATVFGMVNKKTGWRQYWEVFLLVARKNGKSVIGSGFGLKSLVADNEKGAEVYSVATKRDQAKIVWNEGVAMVEQSKPLRKRLKCLNSKIWYKKTRSKFEPLSSESKTQDGLNVSCAIFDEVHAFTDDNLYNVVIDGMSARDQPLALSITTTGIVRENVFDDQYDKVEAVVNGYTDGSFVSEHFLPIIYELDDKSEWLDEKYWIKANPNLGISKNKKRLREKVDDAIAFPEKIRNLLCKDFNVRETSSQSWLAYDELLNRATFDFEKLNPRYGIGGADLSQTTDLTSADMLFEVPGEDELYIESMYWIPEELFLERIRTDKAKYAQWYEQGYIRLCRGNKINPRDITKWFQELMQRGIYLYRCGYDRYAAQMWVGDMEDSFGKNIMIPIAQGKKTLSDPMRLIKADLRSNLINYNDNPVTKWCMSNVAVDEDINGNIQPCKPSNQRKRIDGFAAILNSYVVWNDEKINYRNLIGKNENIKAS